MLGKSRVFFMVLLAVLFVSCDPIVSGALSTFENSVVGTWRGSAANGSSWVITFKEDRTFNQTSTAIGYSWPTNGVWTEVEPSEVPGSTPDESYIKLVASFFPDSPYYFESDGDLLDNMQPEPEHTELAKD